MNPEFFRVFFMLEHLGLVVFMLKLLLDLNDPKFPINDNFENKTLKITGAPNLFHENSQYFEISATLQTS